MEGEDEPGDPERQPDPDEAPVGQRLQALVMGGSGLELRRDLARDDALRDVTDIVHEQAEQFGGLARHADRQGGDHEVFEDAVLERDPDDQREQGGQAAPQRDVIAVIAGQRMERLARAPHDGAGAPPAKPVAARTEQRQKADQQRGAHGAWP